MMMMMKLVENVGRLIADNVNLNGKFSMLHKLNTLDKAREKNLFRSQAAAHKRVRENSNTLATYCPLFFSVSFVQIFFLICKVCLNAALTNLLFANCVTHPWRL